VVSYVYDSWGKLISIDGSLKDSVGVKNPYKYRGYRYDSETELYYLNSRYYNPEFGRFINSDGIIGQTGELLGHNLFIYSKNNPINMSDSDGFRPEFSGTGHDIGDNSDVDFAIMNKRYDYSTGTISKLAPSSNSSLFTSGSVSSARKNLLQGAADAYIAKKVIDLSETPNYLLKFVNRAAERSNNGWLIPIEGAGILRTIGKIGIIGTPFAGYTIWDNLSHYKHPIARTVISGVGIGLGIYSAAMIGTATAPAIVAGVAAGTLLGTAADLAADKWFPERK
jgi:RHS repeat-associated protein